MAKEKAMLYVFLTARVLSITSSSLKAKQWIQKCTLTPFVALELCSEGKASKTKAQQLVSPWRKCSSTPVGFVQGFVSKEKCDNSGSSPIISWPAVRMFTSSVVWNEQWRDSAFMMLLIFLRMRWKIWKGFHKFVSRSVPNKFKHAGKRV